MKKLLSLVVCTIMLLQYSTYTTYAMGDASIQNNSVEYQEVVIDSYDFATPEASTYSLNDENILLHNKGRYIDTNIFKDGENEGNYVVAILLSNKEGVADQTVYFADKPELSTDELHSLVTEESISTASLQSRASTINKYNWTFYSGVQINAKLSSVVTLNKKSGNVTFNGKKASVWDVTSFSELTRVSTIRLNEQVTRLSVADYGAEEVLSYGPVSTNSSNVNFTLTGGVPSASFDYNTKGFNVTNLSSLSGNYGRWRHSAPILGLSNTILNTNPGIRVSNTKGNFAVQLSHTTSMNVTSTSVKSHQTGVVQIIVADR